MPKELYANDPAAILSGAVLSTDTSIPLSSVATFPASGNFTIRIDNEYMLVTAVSGSNFTVTRGQEGSTAASHSSSVAVALVITDGSLRRLCVQSHNGTFGMARRETNYVDGGGVTWTLTDDPSNDRVAVSAAAAGGGFEAPFVAPVLADFGWVNQGSASATLTSGNALYLTCPAAGGVSIHSYEQATTGNFTLIARVTPILVDVDSAWCGFGIHDPITDKYLGVIYSYAAGILVFSVYTWTGTSFSSPTSEVSFPAFVTEGFRWGKFVYDGTNLNVYFGPDGYSWEQVWTGAATTIGTPTQCLVFTNPNSSTRPSPILVSSWNITNP